MKVEEINKLIDDEYWEESDKYILERFNSEEGQKKLKEFKDAQKELVKAVKDNILNFSHTRKELEDYITKGLDETEDVFSIEGIDADNVYDDEALTLYISLKDQL